MLQVIKDICMHVFLNFDILFMEMSMKRKMCFSPFSPKIIFELDLFLIKQGMFFVFCPRSKAMPDINTSNRRQRTL